MPHNKDRPGSPEDWLSHARSDLTLASISPPEGVMLDRRQITTNHTSRQAKPGVSGLMEP